MVNDDPQLGWWITAQVWAGALGWSIFHGFEESMTG